MAANGAASVFYAIQRRRRRRTYINIVVVAGHDTVSSTSRSLRATCRRPDCWLLVAVHRRSLSTRRRPGRASVLSTPPRRADGLERCR